MIWTEVKLEEWWAKYNLTPDKALSLRASAKTDLLFLTKDLLGWNLFQEIPHREVADFFVKKNSTDYKEFMDFGEHYEGLHYRDLLLPRGGFKSVLNVSDCVQYIINWPDITILILTGVQNLAVGFIKELKNHFTLREDGTPKKFSNGQLSKFQILFPEFCLLPKEGGNQDEFICPLKASSQKEPSARAASIEGAQVGWHYDVLKCDDVVTDDNITTPMSLEKTRKKYSLIEATMHPYGFSDKIGTWYHENDLYGVDISNQEKLRVAGEKPEIEILLRAAMKVKSESKHKLEEELREADWELWFPERLSFKFLMGKKRNDPWFTIKYMNDPRGLTVTSFQRERLVTATRPNKQFPEKGLIFQAWDLAYSTAGNADYTVGITGKFAGGRIYILDMVRDRFNDVELPNIIATMAYKWNPLRIAIENSMGVKWLDKEIKREMAKLRAYTPIEYISLGRGSKANSKSTKARPLVRLLGDQRLFFSSTLPKLDKLYEELIKFNGSYTRKDDIVSALSILCTHFVGMDNTIVANSELPTIEDARKQRRAKNFHDMIYRQSGQNLTDSGVAVNTQVAAPPDDFDFLRG